MKLHLPKSLRSALLGAMIMVPAIGITISSTSWAEFAGPADVSYESVSVTTNSGEALTPTANTAYDMTAVAKKTYTINAENFHIKLSGSATTNDKENNLGTITAESLWVAGGSFVVDSAADLNDAGDVYVGGGQIHFTADATYGNKFIVGATNVATGHAPLNAALRIGHYLTPGVDIVMNGNVEVQENAVFGFQNNSTLTINGALSGSGDIKMTLYDGVSRATIAGNATAYTGSISLTYDKDASFDLTFGSGDYTDINTASTVIAAQTSDTQGVAGTGVVEFSNKVNILRFNYAAAETPVYITNQMTDKNTESNTNSNLVLMGGADYILTQAITIDKITLSSNSSATFNNNLTVSGTATINGTSTFNSGIALNGGNMTLNATATLKGASTVAANSTLTITSAGKLTALADGATLTLSAASSVLDLTGISYVDAKTGDGTTTNENVALVNLMNKTTGAGTVKLAAQTGIQTGGTKTNVTIGTNYVVGTDNTASLGLNSWKHTDNGTWRTWTVIKGGSITVGNGAGELNVRAGQQLIIENGGIVNVGQLLLGHEAVDNPGSVVMRGNDSQLTVSQFRGNAQKGNNWNNEVVINGGTLTITGESAFASESGSCLNVSIVGAAGTPVVLKTGTNDVLMSGDAASLGGGTLKLGNVIIDAANTNTITIQNATFGAGIVNNGKLVLGGVLKIEGEYSAYALGENGRYTVDGENGFYTAFGNQYLLVSGSGQNTLLTDEATYSGNSVALWLNADGDVIFTVDGESTTGDFFINNGSVDVVGTGGTNPTGALKYVVGTKGTLNLTDGSLETSIIENNGAVNLGSSAAKLIVNTDNAAAYLTETTGQGTMELKKNVTLSNGGSVEFSGDLVLSEGVHLTLGRGNNVDGGTNTQEYEAGFSSLNALNIDGGTLNLYYAAPELKSMTVVEGATNSTIYIDDTWSEKLSKADATRIASLTLNSSLALTTNWKSSVNIGVLSGAGDLTVSQTETVNEGKTSNLWINDVDNYTGTISVSGKMALTLNIGENESLNSSQLSVSGDKASVTLTGNGEYNLTTLAARVSAGADWRGTTNITSASASGANLALLGNESSQIVINGFSGWIERSVVSSHVVLGANGLTLTAYSTNGTYNFAGGISGTGDFVINGTSESDPHFSIGSNGTSEWKGGFIVKNMAAGKTAELKMVGGGELMAADSKGVQMNSNNGTLSLIIGNADVATTMNGAVSKNANGTLNMTVQGDTVFNAGVNVSQMTLSGSDVMVTLSGEKNTINSPLSIAAGNGLTLDAGSSLTVNSVIQNDGALDIKGSVHWTDTSMAGLTMTYTPDLDRTTNGLGSGVISGLITGTGSLTDNGVVDASFNGWAGTLDTATGLVTADGLVYYVMNSPKYDAPLNPKDPRAGLVYSFGNGQEVLLSNVVHVGEYNSDKLAIPQANAEANSAQAYFVGDNGILAIMGNPDVSDKEKMNEAQRIGDILESTQGRGDIILSTPGYTVAGIDTVIVSVDSATQAKGSLYLAPYVLDKSAANVAQAGIFLHLNDGADISSFSYVHYGYPHSQIIVNGTIGADAETGAHIKNLSASGSAAVYFLVDHNANEYLVLGGETSINGYFYGNKADGTELEQITDMYMDINHANSHITIEKLIGDNVNLYNNGILNFTTRQNDTYDYTVESIKGELDIESFAYEGIIRLLAAGENDNLHINLTLESGQEVKDEQLHLRKTYRDNKVAQGNASLTLYGSGTYILSKGDSIDFSAWSDDDVLYNFAVLDSNWTGTVQVNNLDASGTNEEVEVYGINPADYGNADSTVDFRGFKGYLNDANLGDADMNVLFDMVLTNTSSMKGFELTNESSGNALVFEGNIRGTGDFVVSMGDAEGDKKNETIHFKGDLSGWAPVENGSTALIVEAGEQTIQFTDKATAINADLRTTGGTMNATISNDAAVTVNGAVSHEKGGILNMTVNTEKGTTFNNTVDINKLVVSSDSIANVAAGASVGEVGIQSRFEGAAVLKDGMTIEGNSVTGGSAQNAALSFQTTGSVSNASLEYVSLSSLKAAASIELSGIKYAENVYLAGEANFVSLDTQDPFQYVKTIVAYERQYNEVSFSTSSYAGMILDAQMKGDLTLTVTNGIEGWKDATADALTNVTIKLKGFRVEGMENGERVDKWFEPLHILLSDPAASVDAELAMTVKQLLDVDSYAYVFYEQQADGLEIRMSNIPEPSTATLSLLALAALAARRRRK